MSYRLGDSVRAHDDAVWCVRWRGDGGSGSDTTLVTCGVDESVRVWDPTVLTSDDNGDADIGGSSSSSSSASSASSGAAPSPRAVFRNQDLAVVSCDVSGDGRRCVASSMDGYLRVYDLQRGDDSPTGMSLTSSLDAGVVNTWSVSLHPRTGNTVVTGTHGGGVDVWDLTTGKRTAQWTGIGNGRFSMSVCYSPDGRHVAVGQQDGTVTLLDATTGVTVHSMAGHVKCVRGLAFTPDSRTLLTASDDAYVNMYDVATGQQTAQLAGHASWVLSVAVNAQGTQFATTSADATVKVWDVASRECVHTFDQHTAQVWSCAFSPDGTRLASVGDDCTLQLYAVE